VVILTFQMVGEDKAWVEGRIHKFQRPDGKYYPIASATEAEMTQLAQKGLIVEESSLPEAPTPVKGKSNRLMLTPSTGDLYYEQYDRPLTQEEIMADLMVEMGRLKQIAIHQTAPWTAGKAYVVGEVCVYKHVLYECTQAHTAQVGWEPDKVPALFKLRTPEGVIDEWVQPLGGHDAYALGAKVIYQGHVWVSVVAANVWVPGVYGWEIEW
jgi:hypothetical protein